MPKTLLTCMVSLLLLSGCEDRTKEPAATKPPAGQREEDRGLAGGRERGTQEPGMQEDRTERPGLTGTPTGPLEDQTGRFGDQTRDRSTATQPSGMRNGQTQRDQRQTGQQQGQPLFEAVEDVTGGQVSSAAAQDDRLTGTWVSEPGQAGTGIYRLDFNKRGDQKIATWTIVPEAGTGANEQALDDQLPLKEGMSADYYFEGPDRLVVRYGPDNKTIRFQKARQGIQPQNQQ